MPYSDAVMDHFHNPRHGHRMVDPDVVGKAGNEPGRGPFVVLYLKLDASRACVERASFQTYGCAPAIASASLLAERLPGATREQAARWDAAEIERALGGLPDHKRLCAELAADALRGALAAWPGAAGTLLAHKQEGTP